MKRIAIALLAILFCFLAYLEAKAQELTPDNNTNSSVVEPMRVAVAGFDISELEIDFGVATICESEGGKFTWIKNIPKCDFTDVEHN